MPSMDNYWYELLRMKFKEFNMDLLDNGSYWTIDDGTPTGHAITHQDSAISYLKGYEKATKDFFVKSQSKT